MKNVLCARHNSELSTADEGAIQLRNAILDTTALSEGRKLMAAGTELANREILRKRIRN